MTIVNETKLRAFNFESVIPDQLKYITEDIAKKKLVDTKGYFCLVMSKKQIETFETYSHQVLIDG